MPAPTRTQWRCLVAYHRHHGNVKMAGAELFPGRKSATQQWLVGFHLRAMCQRIGVADRSDASLLYAAALRRELGGTLGSQIVE
jgi:hypothetical protein